MGIPDRVIRWMMAVCATGDKPDKSYTVCKAAYQRKRAQMGDQWSDEEIEIWKHNIIAKYYPTFKQDVVVSVQTLESICSSVENSIEIFMENKACNSDNSNAIKVNIPLTIIGTQTIQTQENHAALTQDINQCTIVNQNNFKCIENRYECVVVECLHKSNKNKRKKRLTFKCVVKTDAKFNKASFASHNRSTRCNHTKVSWPFRCQNCKDDRTVYMVTWKDEEENKQNESETDDDDDDDVDIVMGMDSLNVKTKERVLHIPDEFMKHMDQQHKLTALQWQELKAKLKREKQNKKKRKRKQCQSDDESHSQSDENTNNSLNKRKKRRVGEFVLMNE
eukprot:62013_1